MRGEEEDGELTRGFSYMKNHHGERGPSSLASILSTSRPHGILASSLIQVHLISSEANSRCLAPHPTPPCAGNPWLETHNMLGAVVSALCLSHHLTLGDPESGGSLFPFHR